MKGFRARKMRSGRTYYYFDGTKPETPLGSDYPLAVKKWVELTQEATAVDLRMKALKGQTMETLEETQK